MTGKELENIIRNTFNLEQDDSITREQLDYVLTMLKPSSYLLEHHTIKGNSLTYNIKNHDASKMFMHRPFHVDIVNDLYRDVVIEKSRQMGLSEVAIGQLIYLADTHSYDKVNLMYSFPRGIRGAY